ncbi:hypothetical protein [Streptomyces sp. NPDC101132]|uniref:hypothetical protein n=1 Tax=Streptomyces sp. NPDC101132 TaxID=3366110 RepID=UPI0038208C4D
MTPSHTDRTAPTSRTTRTRRRWGIRTGLVSAALVAGGALLPTAAFAAPAPSQTATAVAHHDDHSEHHHHKKHHHHKHHHKHHHHKKHHEPKVCITIYPTPPECAATWGD